MIFNVSSPWHWLGAGLQLALAVFCGCCACDSSSPSARHGLRAWQLPQFWFAFVSAVVGWMAVWAGLGTALKCASGHCAPWADLTAAALVLLAGAGVAGYLPAALRGLASVPGKAIGRMPAGMGRFKGILATLLANHKPPSHDAQGKRQRDSLICSQLHSVQ